MGRRGTSPRIELVEATDADRPTLENLFQLYQYDFSEFTGSDVEPDGRFGFMSLDAQECEPVRHSYLVRVDGKLAGFALVSQGEAFRDPGEQVWWIDEFFVLRNYRGRGVGERMATELFDRLGGSWEIGEIRPNTPAQAFWRKVLARYTGGHFTEIEMDDHRWRGPVQYFCAKGNS